MLSTSLRRLRRIDLAGCRQLTETGFLHLLDLVTLEDVGLRATATTDYAVSNLILALEGLLHLDVSYCPRISNQTLVRVDSMLRCKVPPHPGPHVDNNPLLFRLSATCEANSRVSFGIPAAEATVEPSLDSGDDWDDESATAASVLGAGDTYLSGSEAPSTAPGLATSAVYVQTHLRLQSLVMKCVNVNYITLSLAARLFPDLRRLDLTASRHLNPLPFRDLALACTSLHTLDLRDCTRVDDESLVYVFSSASRTTLRSVNLRGCHRVTDRSLTFLANNCTLLNSLNLVDCMYITDDCVAKLGNLQYLTRLELGCTSSQPTQVNPDVSPMGAYRLLNSRGCGYALIVLKLFTTTADDLVLFTVSKRCHNLRELYLQDCLTLLKPRPTADLKWEGDLVDRYAVTQRGMEYIAYGVCTNLTRLQLVNCDSVDYEGLRTLTAHPPPKLRSLQFTACRSIGIRCYQLLGSCEFGRSQLRELSVCTDVCSISLEAIRAVLNGCPCLDMLEVRDCKTLPPLEAPDTQALLRSVRRIPPVLEWFPRAVPATPTAELLA